MLHLHRHTARSPSLWASPMSSVKFHRSTQQLPIHQPLNPLDRGTRNQDTTFTYQPEHECQVPLFYTATTYTSAVYTTWPWNSELPLHLVSIIVAIGGGTTLKRSQLVRRKCRAKWGIGDAKRLGEPQRD